MTIAHARALLPTPSDTTPEPLVIEHDEQRDRRALTALAHWATRFSPTVQPCPPDEDDPTWGLAIDITGCERLFKGARRHINAIANAAEWLGLTTRAAAAPTLGLAHAAARFAPHERCTVRDQHTDAALDPLPVRALRIPADIEQSLHEVNITTIAHLRAIHRNEIPSRFGTHLLKRLDQALGTAPEPLLPVKPTPPPAAERAFDGPTKHTHAIQHTVNELITQLCNQLTERQQGALRLGVTLTRSDAPPVGFEIPLSGPSRNPKHIAALAKPHTERANLGFGVERITVIARRVETLADQQTAITTDTHIPHQQQLTLTNELTDTIAARLGTNAVTRPRYTPTHDPARAFTRVHAANTNPRRGPEAPAPLPITHADRPTTLLETPQPVHVIVTTPDGPPHQLQWQGQTLPIIKALGPERLTPDWWTTQTPDPTSNEHPTTDHFKVQLTTGLWLWLTKTTPPPPQTKTPWQIKGLWT